MNIRIFNDFNLKTVRGDLFGGVTAAVVSLPLALAFGVASGAGPMAGIYGAILVGLFASLFGGTSTLISEPTGPMTVVMTAVLTTMMAQNPENGVFMAFTVVMLAGVFQILLGLLKLGKYITLMPYSVVSGFMSGIGIILILLQIAPFLGQSTPPGGVSATLFQLPSLLENIVPEETILGVLTLGILFLMPKAWARFCPPQLVVLILITILSLLIFSDSNIRRIGEIPLGLPEFTTPTTVVNIQTGARSALSGLTRALALIVIVLGAARLTELIPLAVLAGIALKVGVNILDWSFLKRAHRVSPHATMIMYGVMLLTVFFDLIVAVGLGVFIANILTIERLSALQTKNVRAISDADDEVPLSPTEKSLLDSANGKTLLVYLSGPMIFGVSKAIAREHNTIERYSSVVLDLSDVPLIDTTISLAIENTIKHAVDADRSVYVVKPRSQANAELERLGVFSLLAEENVCDTRESALQKAVSAVAETNETHTICRQSRCLLSSLQVEHSRTLVGVIPPRCS